MVLLVVLLAYFLLGTTVEVSGNYNANSWKKNWERCQSFLENPDFSPESVSGSQWRTYYSWNINLKKVCRQIHFEKSTEQIVKRFWLEMDDFMHERPNWRNASLFVTKGSPGEGLLLIQENGPPGKFTGVVNIQRTETIVPPLRSLPLLYFALKLINNGAYLVMMDCLLGITTLSTRAGYIPYRSQIDSVARELQIGDGLQACERDKNEDEQLITGDLNK